MAARLSHTVTANELRSAVDDHFQRVGGAGVERVDVVLLAFAKQGREGVIQPRLFQ